MKLKLEKLFNNSVYRFQFSVCHFPFSSFPFSLFAFQFPVLSIFVLFSILCTAVPKTAAKCRRGQQTFSVRFRLLTFCGLRCSRGWAQKTFAVCADGSP